jgi:hypothetical protein
MPFDDELKSAIEAGIAARKQRQADLREFRDRWRQARSGIIALCFNRASEILNQYPNFDSRSDLKNGASIHLASGTGEYSGPRHELAFASDEAGRTILCSSTLDQIPGESFTLDRIEPSVIEGKVKEFIGALLSSDSSSVPRHRAGSMTIPWSAV